jgi:hypothetical protein
MPASPSPRTLVEITPVLEDGRNARNGHGVAAIDDPKSSGPEPSAETPVLAPGEVGPGQLVVGGVLVRRDEVKPDGRRIAFYDEAPS